MSLGERVGQYTTRGISGFVVGGEESTPNNVVAYLVQREQAGRALSHFFLVRVHFSHARWARSVSMGDSEPRDDDTDRTMAFFLFFI